MSPTFKDGAILLMRWLGGIRGDLPLGSVVVIEREEMPGIFFVKRIQKSHSGTYWVEGGFVIWDKKQPEDFSSAMCEFAWSSIQSPAKIFRLHVVTAEKNKQHPTQKPVALYRWLLRNYAKPGDTIFDSHRGSQSSRIACHMEGFEFTGCELDPEYFEQGNARYEAFLKTYGTPDPKQAIKGQQINLF